MRALLITLHRDQYNRRSLTDLELTEAEAMVNQGKARKRNNTLFEEIEPGEKSKPDLNDKEPLTYQTRHLTPSNDTSNPNPRKKRGRPKKSNTAD